MAERTVTVRLKAIVADYEAALAKAGLSTKGLGTAVSSMAGDVRNGELSLKKIGGTFDGLISGQMAVAAAGVVAAGVLVKFGKDGVDAYVNLADHVREYQRVAGGSAEDASRMVEAFHAVGVTSEEGATAIFRLSQNLDRNAESLRNAGVVVARDRQGNIDLNKTLLNLSDAYRNITDPQQRNVLMMQALSRGAIVLAPLLAKSRGEIEEFWQAAGRHGLILSQQDLDQAYQYKLAVHELGDAWKGFEVQIGRGVVPILTTLVSSLETAVDYIHRFSAFSTETKHTKDETLLSQWNKDLNNFEYGSSAIDKAIAKVTALAKANGDAVTSSEMAANTVRANLLAIGGASGVAQPRLEALAVTMGINLATATDKEKDTLRDAAIKLNAAITPTQKLVDVTETLSNAYATGAEKVAAYKTAVDAVLGSQLNAESATITLHQSLQTLADELATGQQVGESVGQYQDRLGADLVAVVRNVDAARQAMVANGEIAATDVGAQQAFMVQALQQVEEQYPILRTEIDSYIAKLGQIPGTVTTIAQFLDSNGNPLTDQSFEAWALAQSNANAGGQLGATTVGAPAVGHAKDKEKSAESALNTYLKAVYQERVDITDNMYAAGKLSTEAYVRALDGELVGLKAYTSEWVAVQNKKQQALQQLSDFYKGVIDHQRELQDNEYAVGVLGKDQYLQLLEDRLAGLEKYSNAWKQVWDEIQRIEGDALGAEIKVIQAYDQGRQFQQAFDAAASSRAFSPQLSPVNVGSGAATATPAGSSVSYNPVFHVSSTDPVTAATLANQKMRDAAALLGV